MALAGISRTRGNNYASAESGIESSLDRVHSLQNRSRDPTFVYLGKYSHVQCIYIYIYVYALTMAIVPRVENFLNDVVNCGGKRNTRLYSVATKTMFLVCTLFDILLLCQFLHSFGYTVQQ